MSYEMSDSQKATGIAATAVTKNKFVKKTGASSVSFALCGAGEDMDGVALTDAAAGEAFTYALPGSVVEVEAAGAVTAAGRVASAAAGELADASTGDYVGGKAYEAGADGGLVTILFVLNGIEPA